MNESDHQSRSTQSDVAQHDRDETCAEQPEPTQPRRIAVNRLLLLLVAVGLFGFLVVYPSIELAITRLNPPESSSLILDMTFSELIQLRSVQVFAGVWAFSFGACIGSFLNVLVYRQPLGLSVLTKPSQCPKCDTKIESRDNIPIIGWLCLGGRCRACGTKISPRYPIVEAIVGLMFATLVFVELTSGGANLPVRRPNTYTGFVWTIFYPKWDLITLTLYHFHLFIMLLTWGLMKLDGARVPWRSIITAFVIAVACPLLWTKLAVVPPGFIGTKYHPQELDVTAISLQVGGATGIVIASAASLGRITSFATAAPSLALCGVTLGWQATISIGVAAVVLQGLILLIVRPQLRINFVITLLIVALIHHLFWSSLFW